MSQGPLALQGDQACPCARAGTNGKALRFSGCCGQYLEGDAPPDAQSLMRSRYSAFVLQREAYLLATWHASTRPATLAFDTDGKWLGLQVRSAQVLDAEHAQVEFVARFKPARAPAWRLHERSRFVLENGRWYYLEGVQLP
ncbi:MAG: YchJ family metal-binding protein [Betaproteobacteria bacterium]|jgi:SEC-C motif-containing protein